MTAETDTLAMDDARTVPTAERKKLAATGKAMPDLSFPIKTTDDLKNAISLWSKRKNPALAKAHIIKRAKALGATNLLPAGWLPPKAESAAAGSGLIGCPECERAFLHEDRLQEHAESVHTFDDVQRIVSEAVRERFAVKTTPSDKTNCTYVWLNDLADDWAVFTVEGNASSTMYKIPYTLGGQDSLAVTLGDPFEVRRRTVYDPVQGSTKKGEA